MAEAHDNFSFDAAPCHDAILHELTQRLRIVRRDFFLGIDNCERLVQYPDIKPPKPAEKYVPKIYGYRIHKPKK